MARTYARIDVKRGADDDWRALTLEQKAVYDFLLTHPKLSLCGSLDVKMSVWCRYAPDLDSDRLSGLLGDLEQAGFVAWDRDTDEVVIRTFVRHDGVLQNRNLGRGMWAAWQSVESETLQDFLVDNLPESAFEPRFEPPFLAVEKRLKNGGSNYRSEPPCEPPSELPHPHPQPILHPSSGDRSLVSQERVVGDNSFAARLAAREQLHSATGGHG